MSPACTANFNRVIAPFATVIRRAKQKGELPGDTDEAMLIAALTGPFYRRWFSREPLTDDFAKRDSPAGIALEFTWALTVLSLARGLPQIFGGKKQERRGNDCQADIEHQTDRKVQIGNPPR